MGKKKVSWAEFFVMLAQDVTLEVLAYWANRVGEMIASLF
jgi:hypothetical protein